MFFKLAVRNVKRSIKDYAVYFITITFGVCIFYVFNSMDSQAVMQYLSGHQRAGLVEGIMGLIDMLSGFVSVVLALLILYANTFLVRRRKRELATYMLLGMQRGRIAWLLFLETLCIGILALAVGLLLGVVLSQALSAFTVRVFSIRMTQFHFVFSAGAMFKTLLYFGVIFLVVMIFNSLSVSRCKLIKLMQAERVGQELKLKSVGASVVMFLAGAALLAAAYAMLLRRGMLTVDGLFWVMIAMGSAGTLLFFRSLSGFLLRICQANRRVYYKNLNMFVLRQFNFKIGTTYVSMTVICLLLLLAIGITACSVGLNSSVESLTNGKAPYDVSIQYWEQDDVEKALGENGFQVTQELAAYHIFPTYTVRTQAIPMDFGAGEQMEVDSFNAIAISDFNRLMQIQGRPAISLEPGEYTLVLLDEPTGRESTQMQLLRGKIPLMVGGVRYELNEGAVRRDPILTTTSYYSGLVILPDGALEGLEPQTQNLAGDYNGDKEETERRFNAAVDMLQSQGREPYVETRLSIYMDTMGSKLLVLFIGIYLGIIFLLTSAAVLALQQLSQAADNAGRYKILARLGASEGMRNRSLYIQIFLYFFLPLALAVVHAAVGMTAANAVINQFGHVDTVASSAAAALFILVVYGAYFLATCWGSRRIVNQR